MPRAARTHRSLPPPLHGDGRPSACQRGYGREWQAIRLSVLQSRPVCEVCDLAPATEVDHRVTLRAGGTHDEANLMAMCKPCHSRKTCLMDKGFGRERK